MRLIDADALLDEFLKRYTERERNRNLVFAACEIKQDFADMISNVPTVDAVPIRHGHWIRVSLIGVFKCSECGSQIIVTDSKFAKEVCLWCLNYGAKMDEES